MSWFAWDNTAVLIKFTALFFFAFQGTLSLDGKFYGVSIYNLPLNGELFKKPTLFYVLCQLPGISVEQEKQVPNLTELESDGRQARP